MNKDIAQTRMHSTKPHTMLLQSENNPLHQITRIEPVSDEHGEPGYRFHLNTGITLHPIFPKREYKKSKYARELERAQSNTINQVLCEYYLKHNNSFDGLVGKIVCATVGDATPSSLLPKDKSNHQPILRFRSGHSIDFVKAFSLRLSESVDKETGHFRAFITKLPIYALLLLMGKQEVAANTIGLSNEFAHIHVQYTPYGTLIYQATDNEASLNANNIVQTFEKHFKAPQQKDNFKVDWSLDEKEKGYYLHPKDKPSLIMCKERQTHVSYRSTTADDYDRIVNYVTTFIGAPVYHPPRNNRTDSPSVVSYVDVRNKWFHGS